MGIGVRDGGVRVLKAGTGDTSTEGVIRAEGRAGRTVALPLWMEVRARKERDKKARSVER